MQENIDLLKEIEKAPQTRLSNIIRGYTYKMAVSSTNRNT